MITNLTTTEITPRPSNITCMRSCHYSSNQDEQRWGERVKECYKLNCIRTKRCSIPINRYGLNQTKTNKQTIW